MKEAIGEKLWIKSEEAERGFVGGGVILPKVSTPIRKLKIVARPTVEQEVDVEIVCRRQIVIRAVKEDAMHLPGRWRTRDTGSLERGIVGERSLVRRTRVDFVPPQLIELIGIAC